MQYSALTQHNERLSAVFVVWAVSGVFRTKLNFTESYAILSETK